MTGADPGADARPAVVTAGFWSLVVGAALLCVGGLATATISFDALRQAAPSTVTDHTVRSYLLVYRGVGLLFAASGLALGALAARARRRDPRFRRSAVVLALVIVLLVGVAAVFAGISILALLSLLPIIVGVLLLSRAAAINWFFPSYHVEP